MYISQTMIAIHSWHSNAWHLERRAEAAGLQTDVNDHDIRDSADGDSQLARHTLTRTRQTPSLLSRHLNWRQVGWLAGSLLRRQWRRRWLLVNATAHTHKLAAMRRMRARYI